MIELFLDVINKNLYQDYEIHQDEADDVLHALEKAGMLPPLSTPKLVPDLTRKGTFMHTETKREWDDE